MRCTFGLHQKLEFRYWSKLKSSGYLSTQTFFTEVYIQFKKGKLLCTKRRERKEKGHIDTQKKWIVSGCFRLQVILIYLMHTPMSPSLWNNFHIMQLFQQKHHTKVTNSIVAVLYENSKATDVFNVLYLATKKKHLTNQKKKNLGEFNISFL